MEDKPKVETISLSAYADEVDANNGVPLYFNYVLYDTFIGSGYLSRNHDNELVFYWQDTEEFEEDFENLYSLNITY